MVNSFTAIVRAMRPQTLPGAAVPVIIALSLATHDTGTAEIKIIPAVLCLLFAFVMQINANFVNDYFDFLKGRDDDERLGPPRACAQGWITLPFMRILIFVTTVCAAFIGIPLIFYGGYAMIAVGVFCMAGCIAYTTHLSRWGMGDVMVLVFFGIIPVCLTYYLQTGYVSVPCIVASIGCGIEIDSMLIINNFRDHHQDAKHGKRTLSVLIGRKNMLRLFRYLPYLVCCLGIVFIFYNMYLAFALPVFYLMAHNRIHARMTAIGEGKALNTCLAANGKVMLLYALTVGLGFLLS